MFRRFTNFQTIPQNLKKISRAFYEAKYNLTGGYIHNYDQYQNIRDKRMFLEQRGKLELDKEYTDEEINSLYEQNKARYLSKLEKDDAIIY